MKLNSNKQKEKRWILKNTDSDSMAKINRIARDLGINPIIARLLYGRGYTDVASVKAFLYMEKEILCDPFLMKDMDKGVDRINKAVRSKEKITIFGDYDVDGVTAVCTLYLYLKNLGASVDYYIPNRSGEGYGVSNQAIDQLKEQGTSLIITVDTGVTAVDEVSYAKDCGIDVLVTDHHECMEKLPDACAIINPHRPDCSYPFKELAGVGVVFKLISAYQEKVQGFSRRNAAEYVFSKYADMVAIGTIADVMPIKSENRLIVSYGLSIIEKRPRPGLLALMNAANKKNDPKANERKKKRSKITSGYIGYTIAPRINAAGRVRSATVAVELFLANDSATAERVAESLCDANRERQAEENVIMQQAYEKIEAEGLENDLVMVLAGDGWHHGVIGIVASRISEKYSRPAILVSFDSEDNTPSASDMGKGSGRSIKGLNLVDALCYCSDVLVKFGGHELAAGLSVTRENLTLFRKKINEFAKENINSDNMMPSIEADTELPFDDISLSLVEDLQSLEPYGVGNPMPVFASFSVNVNEIAPISEGKHTRFYFGDGKNSFSAVFFSNSPESLELYNGDKVDILYNLDINEWLGRRNVQLNIKDVRPSVTQSMLISSERSRFDEIWNGAQYSADENVLPCRDDFATVYRHIVNMSRQGIYDLSIPEIISGLKASHEAADINYIKLKIIIKVFTELNIVGINEISEDKYRFKVFYSSSKTDLDKSGLLRRIKNQQKKS